MAATPKLTGQIWFDFKNPQVWLFYRFVRSAASAGIAVGLDWQPLPTIGQELAMTTQATLTEPVERGRFLHAMLGRVHLEGDDPTATATVHAAAAAADIPVPDRVDATLLAELGDRAEGIGVESTPSMYRHGPPMHITLTEAALMDDPASTVRTIVAVADNDAIWELRKP